MGPSGDRDQGLQTYPVLLAGGSGTRLWPVSRERFPKQLVKFIGDDSLVQATLKRLVPVLDINTARIVCGEEHALEIKRHMVDIGIAPEGKVIHEPCGRNTAAAILLAVLSIIRNEENAILCVFPADHVIRDISGFHRKLTAAIRLAEEGHIVTFGITPGYPETGYGYIEGIDAMPEGALTIKRFVEKPDRETAVMYLAAGNFFWNSGMFAFKASVVINEFKAFQPDLYRRLEKMVLVEKAVTPAGYRELTDISFDYAIMEKTAKGVILPSDFGWSDIGSWKSLYDFLPKDPDNNVIDGDVIARETRDSFIMGHQRLIATNRIENMVVVETPDSIFVSDIDNSRDVKSIVTTLKAQGRKEYHHHRTVHQSWGRRTLLDQGNGFNVMRLVILPGLTCRFEPENDKIRHISVVTGTGEKIDGKKRRVLSRGDTWTILPDTTVELKNCEDIPLEIIQVRLTPGHDE